MLGLRELIHTAGILSLTRIGVYDACGVRKTQPVYRLPRTAFDEVGDPLIFEEELL